MRAWEQKKRTAWRMEGGTGGRSEKTWGSVMRWWSCSCSCQEWPCLGARLPVVGSDWWFFFGCHNVIVVLNPGLWVKWSEWVRCFTSCLLACLPCMQRDNNPNRKKLSCMATAQFGFCCLFVLCCRCLCLFLS
jgi:hypothetical protein